MKRFYRQYIEIMGIKIYIFLAASVILSFVTGAMQRSINGRIGENCLKDFLIYYNYRIAPIMLLTVVTFAIAVYLNKMYESGRIVRYVNIQSFYLKVILGMCAHMLIIVAAVAVIVVTGGAASCGFIIDNWQNEDSYALIMFGEKLVNTPVYTIIAAELASYFIIGIINGMLIMIIQRFTGNMFVGYFAAVIVSYLFLSEPNVNFGKINAFYIKEGIYQNGWSISSLIFPAALVVILLFIIMVMGKRDLIKKR